MTQAIAPEAPAPVVLQSFYTESFPQLLAELRVSILVSTYQWDQLVILRYDPNAHPEDAVDLQCRPFHRPMGLAYRKDRLAIGTQGIIQEYRNVPSVAAKLQPQGRVDAAFLPRTIHATGEIAVHEMEWGGPDRDELWFVNTRFSCLCTRERNYSFRPRWHPRFVSKLSPEDRCHLNGLCMIDGQPAYVTALGETDADHGWRVNKKDGGILIDTRSDEIICRGLSMPHSPRWYQGKLWVLEAGAGTLSTVDVNTGQRTRIAALPGFVRGLDFLGPYAFVGLSLVRELAIYNGLPIIDTPVEKRATGVWVVDTRSGQIVAFLKFEGRVREVFSVAVLSEYQFPDVICSDVSILKDSFTFPPQCTDLTLSAV